MMRPTYSRILLKLSGEALMGDQTSGMDNKACRFIAEAIKEIYDLEISIGLVIGGGNIFRGSKAEEFHLARTPADHVGMLATAINGILLGQVLSSLGCKTAIMGALNFGGIIEPYNWSLACHYLNNQTIVIFVGGTGNPYFTTDTAAALRASEIEAEVLLKATKVDGIYDRDPMKHRNAVMYEHLTYSQVLTNKLSVMDATAVALCRENDIPIHVFNLFEKGSFKRAVCERKGGTIVTGD